MINAKSRTAKVKELLEFPTDDNVAEILQIVRSMEEHYDQVRNERYSLKSDLMQLLEDYTDWTRYENG